MDEIEYEDNVDVCAENIFMIEIARQEEYNKKTIQLDKINSIINRLTNVLKYNTYYHLKYTSYDTIRIHRSILLNKYFNKMRRQWTSQSHKYFTSLIDINTKYNQALSLPTPPPPSSIPPPPPPSSNILPPPPPPKGILLPPSLLLSSGGLNNSNNVILFNDDPKPPKGILLKRLNISSMPQSTYQLTFWCKNRDEMKRRVKDIPIDWTYINEKYVDSVKLFEKKVDRKVEARAREGIVDMTRLNQFEIILSQYKLPVDDTKRGLVDATISYDDICQISMLISDDEDNKKIIEWTGEEESLYDSVRVVREILKIPRVKNRVKCMMIKHELLLDVKKLNDQIVSYRDIFDTLYVMLV